MGLDKAATKNIAQNVIDTRCIMWRECIKWEDSFLKQNIKEQNKLLRKCNRMQTNITKEFINIGCQLKKKDNARDATADELDELKEEFQKVVDSFSNEKDFDKRYSEEDGNDRFCIILV